MPSFTEVVNTAYSSTLDDGTRVYTGSLHPLYTVAAVPHGGYVLGVILDAIIHTQENSNQPDPIHVSAHYLEPSKPGPFEVRIRTQRTGRRYSNLTADLYQNGTMNVTTHVIVGTLPDVANLNTSDRSMPSLLPPHPYATRTPFRTHPSVSRFEHGPPKLTFNQNINVSNDKLVQERSRRKAEVPEESDGGVDDATWHELLYEQEGVRLGLPAMAFLADLCRNTPGILPRSIRPGESWFPTMSFQLEFKVKLSHLPSYIAPHTFGVYSTGRHILEGRHEVHSEVWTAPSALGKPGELSADDPSWREKMFCVVRSSQMALTIPLEVNRRKALAKNGGDGEKAKL